MTSWLDVTRRLNRTFAEPRLPYGSALRVALSLGVPTAALLASGHERLLFAALGSFAALYGSKVNYRRRREMQLSVALVLIMSTGLVAAASASVPSRWPAIVTLAGASGLGYLISDRLDWQPQGSLWVVFTAGATTLEQIPWTTVASTIMVCAASAGFAVILGRLEPPARRAIRRSPHQSRRQPTAPPDAQQGPVPPTGITTQLVQHSLAPLVAGALAQSMGGGHPYWAMVSSVVPISVHTARHQLTRAVHRAVGTVVGVGVGFVLLVGHPHPWWALVFVVTTAAWAELFMTRHYALAVAGITPLVLLLQYLTGDTRLEVNIHDRLLETALGLGTGLLVILASTWRRPCPRRDQNPTRSSKTGRSLSVDRTYDTGRPQGHRQQTNQHFSSDLLTSQRKETLCYA